MAGIQSKSDVYAGWIILQYLNFFWKLFLGVRNRLVITNSEPPRSPR